MSGLRQSEGLPFPSATGSVPAVTAAQMAEVDRLAVARYGIELLQMMENAGGALARVVRSLWPHRTAVTVLAGGGGNGGGALAAARRLAAQGLEVTVVVDRPLSQLRGAAAHQAATLEKMEVAFLPEPGEATLVVDGLIGYGLDRRPHGRAAELIRWAQGASAVISLDVPSGVDATTGRRHGPHVLPEVTLTLALPKTGLTPANSGTVLLADIGIPPVLYSRHLRVDAARVFTAGDIVDVTPHLRRSA
ncbi:MAG: NAD(P)H-hydrate epimerase [Actinomycetota bacterium]